MTATSDMTVSIPDRPLFLEKLKHYQTARLARCIALTGNIYDLFPFREGNETSFAALEELLFKALKKPCDPHSKEGKTLDPFIIIALRSNGIHFVSPQDKKVFLTIFQNVPKIIEGQVQTKINPEDQKLIDARDELKKRLTVLQTSFEGLEKRDASTLASVQMVANFLREVGRLRELLSQTKVLVRSEKEYYIRPICIVVEQAHMIFPNLTIAQMTAQHQEIWMVMHELLLDESIWPDDQTAEYRSDFIILLSPTVAELNPALFNLPKTVSCDVLATDETVRKTFTAAKLQRLSIPGFYEYKDEDLERAIEEFARDTGGLTLRTLDDLLIAAHRDQEGFKLTRRSIAEEVNRKLQVALGDTIKLVQSQHTKDNLRGVSKLWPELEYMADLADDPKRAPFGIIIPGPNGAGKTYILEAWSVFTGRTVLTIAGGMRNPYYGQTDIYAERFEFYASAYNRLCVIVDEAHKAFGSIHSRDTYQAEANLSRHFVQMMGNPKYRSKIFWVFITTRPDLLDPDFLRRFPIAVPVFDPEGEDAEDFLNWMVENFTESGTVLTEEEKTLLKEKSCEPGREFSAQDYRTFMDEYITRRNFFRQKKRDLPIKEFAKNWKSSAVKLGKKRELQMHLAALYCSWPDELLPTRFRKKDGAPMDVWELEAKIQALKLEITFDD